MTSEENSSEGPALNRCEWQVSWLAGRVDVAVDHQQMPAFPTVMAVMKTGRFVDKEASAPIDHAATSVACPVRSFKLTEKHHCISVTLASRRR